MDGQLVYTPNEGFSGEDSFTYVVSDGNGGTDTATVTITVNPGMPEPEVQFSAAQYSVDEGIGDSMEVTLVRSGDLTSASEVLVSITGGSATSDDDYNASSFPLTVTFAANEDSQTVTIPIIDDTEVESTETINFGLTTVSNAEIGNQDTTQLKIFNNDLPEVIETPTEGNDNVEGTDEIDNIQGNLGRDVLTGNGGDDVIDGGIGSEILTGGEGADRFVYESFFDAVDTITDFEPGEDVIDFSAILNTVEPYSRRNPSYLSDNAFEDYLRFESVGSDTQVKLDRRGDLDDAFFTMVTLEGVQPDELTASDFIL